MSDTYTCINCQREGRAATFEGDMCEACASAKKRGLCARIFHFEAPGRSETWLCNHPAYEHEFHRFTSETGRVLVKWDDNGKLVGPSHPGLHLQPSPSMNDPFVLVCSNCRTPVLVKSGLYDGRCDDCDRARKRGECGKAYVLDINASGQREVWLCNQEPHRGLHFHRDKKTGIVQVQWGDDGCLAGGPHPGLDLFTKEKANQAYGAFGEPDVEMVNHPKHYNSHPSGVECIVIVEHMTFNAGSAVKYLWRAGLKDVALRGPNTVEDLKKAAWYVAREIERLEKEGAK